MILRQPPPLATWLLDRLGYVRHNAALAGDLLEEFRSGRSATWYWRQTFMVIWNGVTRNAVVLRSYWVAVAAGFAAQLLITIALWWCDSLRTNGASGTLATVFVVALGNLFPVLLVIAGIIWVFREQRKLAVPSMLQVKVLVIASETGPHKRSTLLKLVSLDTFTSYLGDYYIFGNFLPHLSIAQLVAPEISWFGFWKLRPSLFRAPGPAPGTVAEAPARPIPPPLYWSSELGLTVALSGGRTVRLRPETVAETIFAAADEELIAAAFRDGASFELLRRAIWLACARQDPASYFPGNPAAPMTPSSLIALISETACIKSVDRALYVAPRKSFLSRLRLRTRHH